MSRRGKGKGGKAAGARASAKAKASPPTDAGASTPGAIAGPSRLRWILLGVVVMVSTILVAGAFMPAPHTGGDNAAYLSLAHSLLQHGSYTELFDPTAPPHTKYPPAFPALLAAFMLLGFRTWSAFKALAAASTVAAVALSYLWAERRVGPVWAAGVALLVAASSAVVYYSHWILSDPTFVAFTLLGLWALERSDEDDAPTGWLVLGVVATGLAYFTRSAGLPLVVALLGWLVLRRRWRALGAVAVGLGLPMVLWLLRARGGGEGEYVSEFWLVNPYDPGMGQVGIGGLAGRVWENGWGYVGTHIPAGIIGPTGAGGALLGMILVGAALAGWALTVRRRVGPSEIFLPLYGGLILLWPVVWSGDRFALPLFPLLFLYAALALRRALAGRGATALSAAGALSFCAILLPAGGAWTKAVAEASNCGALIDRAGPFACYGPGVAAFVEVAAWSGSNLPPGSAVLTRKPRLFYVLSGVPSRTFPFTDDPDVHLELADRLGARYELYDQWDGQASRFIAPAVQRRPGAFCSVGGFGPEGATQMLGVLPAEERVAGGALDDGSVRIASCSGSYLVGEGAEAYSPISSRIPLLDRAVP